MNVHYRSLAHKEVTFKLISDFSPIEKKIKEIFPTIALHQVRDTYVNKKKDEVNEYEFEMQWLNYVYLFNRTSNSY